MTVIARIGCILRPLRRVRCVPLKKSFMEDLKSLLTRDQEARWPIVERELRRMFLWARRIVIPADVSATAAVTVEEVG